MAGPEIVIVGGGHNGLVAAAYLARAGRRVQVLERLDHVGGAAVSAHAFDGVDARLSRYSYLVSLLPRRIVDELGARVRLMRRRYSSYTPDPSTAGRTGLLIGPQSTFGAIGAAGDEAGLHRVLPPLPHVTARLWPTLTQPLRTPRRSTPPRGRRRRVAVAMIDEPIGDAITERRRQRSGSRCDGDRCIDRHIRSRRRSRRCVQNVCFLYHLMGGGTGDWDVPIGGMGAVSGALAAAASGHGAEIVTGAEVYAIDPDGEVRYRRDGQDHRVRRRFRTGQCDTCCAGAAAGRAGADAGPWRAGQGQPDAAAAATAA